MIEPDAVATISRRELVRLLAIGGSDCCGGAGIQADIKTGAALGVDVSSAITAVTAQNSLGVQQVWSVPEDMLTAQIDSVCADIPPHAVKLGMLFDAARVRIVTEAIRAYKLERVVCDPVLASTSGKALLDEEGRNALLLLLPLIALLTPNTAEAAALSGREICNQDEYLNAGRALLDLGVKAVLLKGGHMGGDTSADALLLRDYPSPQWFAAPRIATRNDHGTGCVLASAIAAHLALGCDMHDAVAGARRFVQQALERSASVWNGNGRGGMNLLPTGAA